MILASTSMPSALAVSSPAVPLSAPVVPLSAPAIPADVLHDGVHFFWRDVERDATNNDLIQHLVHLQRQTGRQKSNRISRQVISDKSSHGTPVTGRITTPYKGSENGL